MSSYREDAEVKCKLRIGLLLDDYNVPAWTFAMFESLLASDCLELSLVVLNDNPRETPNKSSPAKSMSNYGRLCHRFFRTVLETIYSTFIERSTYLPNALTNKNSQELLASFTTIKIKTKRENSIERFNPTSIEQIAQHQIDVLILCGFGVLKGDILNIAKYGIWSLHHSDYTRNRGGPPGFWESMESWPETGSILQILTENPDNGNVLFRSYTCTHNMSVRDNKSRNFWKSLSFMTRKLEELHRVGEDAFFSKVEQDNEHPDFYDSRLYVQPTNSELVKLTFRKLLEKSKLLFANQFFLNQWILMFHLSDELSSSLWRYKKMIPPMDRSWADPHIVYRGNLYFIFVEEFLYETGKGHISVITMDEKGNYSGPDIILEKPYHLSYPFVFEHEGQHYMVPETMGNSTVELYKCVEFPNKWEFQMNLMENVRAVDATLVHRGGTWWMFVNMIETEGASTGDELFLFSSKDLFSDSWKPHPANPIVSDCKLARPAGKLFSHNGNLYRPSQDCCKIYGHGFNINHITTLDEHNYAETPVTKVKPNWDKSIIGTHTFNRTNALHVIDAIYKRRK